ncbi:hypothetical protein OOK39_40920 [Streptomyces sp. NBC_00264]|uniref:hypothetical protein n=1 Tax=unclassified Streptomyces TaxID=2593676 RepID=UPI0013DDA080|nr:MULTISPECIES: hypothetical protein [unclassified Streptomyces]WSG56425.1 hypothetical protein OHA38_42915 [Streptomyces sp. NBC_01732]WSX07589.1 hypothetical protein OG355_45785 [Streptomyces sp. NBC_00987]MCX4399878.1 hypothetical protein [Streptomyces sp. NBC_01767]MCX5106328.1 hypothetical protein [Streptomyces sp. NBC_00439]MCX5165847.1 hypothetical protein [Streptomyces sp. NBC_00305]
MDEIDGRQVPSEPATKVRVRSAVLTWVQDGGRGDSAGDNSVSWAGPSTLACAA